MKNLPISELRARYETGMMGKLEVVAMFQIIIDSRLDLTLPPHYGMIMSALLNAGLITKPKGYRKNETI